MLNFTENNSIKIANSFFKKKKNKKWTCLALDEITRNEIDFFVVNDMRVVTDVARCDQFEFPSDP